MPPVSLLSTIGRSSESNVDVSLVDVSTSASTAVTSMVVTSMVEASSSSPVCFSAPLVVPASQCSLAGSVVSSSAVVPISHSISSSPSSSAAFPLPYMPHHPWPVSSLQHRPTVLQQASQPTFSLISPSSLLFTSPPSCHLGPVPASTAPSFHSIHQQAPLNSILQQAPLNSILQQAPLNSIHQQAPLSSIHQQATLHPILQQAPLPPNPIHQQVPLTPIYQQGLVNPILQQPSLNSVPPQAFGITQSSGWPLSSSAAAIHPLMRLQQAGLREASGLLRQVLPLSKAFVLGLGFLPIPYKLVVAITSGQFVDFSSLLVKPSEPLPSGPVISIDGRVVVSHNPKPLRRLHDIAQWVQAFSIYTLVMVSYCPWRAVDLLKYQLLILQTQAQFGGQAWLNYDEAFRCDAAARHVSDWSSMHVELYNFHTASTRLPATPTTRMLPERSGAHFSTSICCSWNAGRCISSRAFCCYLHVCDTPRCRGPHRSVHCPNISLSQPSPSLTVNRQPSPLLLLYHCIDFYFMNSLVCVWLLPTD